MATDLDMSACSSTDKLINQLRRLGKNDMYILQHTITPDFVPQTDQSHSAGGKKGILVDVCIEEANILGVQHNHETVTHIPLEVQDEYHNMAIFAEEKRSAYKCTDEQEHLMIGLAAWVSRRAKRWFQLFPNVVYIDIVEDTNKESRPFLTVSIKDSSGHHHIVLRAFLPNQRAWAFRWIFQSVMPKLLSTIHLRNVQMFLTDGDSQETTQLDAAIRKFFPSANRRRCSFHMIFNVGKPAGSD